MRSGRWSIILRATLLLVLAGCLVQAAAAVAAIEIESDISADGGVTWLDADTPPGPYLLQSAPVPRFRFTVRNTGDVAFSKFVLTDSLTGLNATFSSVFPPGTTAQWNVDSDWTAGANAGTATVTGTYNDQTVTDTDPVHYVGASPAIDVEVLTNGEDADTPPGPSIPAGSPVLWTYVVTNTGDVALTNVAVVDDKGVVVSAPKTMLQPDESMTATASGTAVPGQYANIGTVTASPPSGPAVTASDPSHYRGVGIPAIDFETYVSADGGVTWLDADTPPGPDVLAGTAPVFKFVTTNTGDVPLSMVSAYGHLGPIVTFAPGESFEATEEGIWEPGQRFFGSSASGTYNGQTLTDSDVAWYYGATPAISIETRTNGEDADTPPGPWITAGAPVQWTYVVTNTGEVALSNVAVTDDRGVTVSAPKTVLEPGESMTATASGTAVPGQYANVGTVTGTPAGGPAVSASDPSHYLGKVPGIGLEVLTNGEDADVPPGRSITVGSPIAWTYVVTNTGDVHLSNVAVTDDRGVVVTAPKTVLAPGESMTATASGTAVLGQYANVGTVTASPPSGPPVTASDPSHYLGVGVAPPAPVANYTASPTTGMAPLYVFFEDTSTGDISEYSMDFGDGTIWTGTYPHAIGWNYTYAQPGTYDVNLTVTGPGGTDSEVKTGHITVVPPAPPVAQFHTTYPGGVIAPVDVSFFDDSTGDGITNWSWDFGDGGTSTDRNPVHTFTTDGLFTVNLTVANAAGSDSEVKTDCIQIGTPIPVARFEANVTSGIAPLAVRFEDSSNLFGQNLTSRLWEFGDGETSTGQDPVHVYAAPGTYTVNLTVANQFGPARLSKPDYITVTAPPITGADRAYYLVSTVPAGAEIYLEGLGGTRYLQGDTTAGPLNVTLCLTCTPVRKIVASLSGYRDAVWDIATYPAKGETVPVTLTLERETTGPFPAPHVPAAVIQAEDFDTGGEGVAYHDVEPANLGNNNNHRPGEGVDVETENGVTNVAYVRAGEWLTYTVDTTIAGTFRLTLRAANPDATPRAVTVSVDGTPVSEVVVGSTGGWTRYAEFASAPFAVPAGRHAVTLAFEGADRVNLDWLRLAAGTVPPTTTTPVGGQPYPSAHVVPGRVEAEDYDVGGFSDTTPANEGGAYRNDAVDIERGGSNYDVGWTRAGEYLQYSVDATAPGAYTMYVRVANPGAAKSVTVRVNGAARSLTIPATGSFGSWATAALGPVDLAAGRNTVRVETGSAASFNLDYLEFAAGTPTATPGTGGASFTAAPLTAPRGAAVKFTVTPASGKAIRSAWWSFDAPAHLNTWNSRATNPTFFYPQKGTFSPLVKITYTDGSTESVHRPGYVRAT